MSLPKLKAVLEAYLFLSEKPLSVKEASEKLGVSTEEIEEALRQMDEELKGEERGIFLERVAGGYVLSTKPEVYQELSKLGPVRRRKLSRAALETLAIIARNQPITLPEINSIRGKDSTVPLQTLVSRGLVKAVGRRRGLPGRPFLYATTEEFLKVFGLNSLEELDIDETG